MKIIQFTDIKTSDLFIDAIYEGGTNKNISDDPIKEIFPVGNAGGFRPRRV